MNRIIIIQPAVPKYRRRFFEVLAREIDFTLLYSNESIDFAVSDVAGISCDVVLVKAVNLGGNAVWQDGVVTYAMKADYDQLVISGNPRYASNMLAMLIARLRGKKVIWWGHAISPTSRKHRAWLRFKLMGLADMIMLYYQEELDRLPVHLRARSFGIDNSVDTMDILARSRAVSQTRIVEHRLKTQLGDSPVILTIGRLTKKASVDLILQAFQSVFRNDRLVRLVILGGGPEMEALKSLADDLGIADAVYWVGRIFDEDAIALWMRSANMFVYGGAVGLSIIHAFSYALPAVISGNMSDHNPEALLFKNGKFGVTFEKNNPESLAGAFRNMLADPSASTRMGLAAQSMVRNRLGIERMAKRFARVIVDDY